MVDDKVLEAVARLDRDPDFRVFMEEVQRRRDAARDSMELASDMLLVGRAQGASILSGELIELATQARDALTRRQSK